jgi:hypothetical protein
MALLLSFGAFVLASGEAQAKQPQADQQPMVVQQHSSENSSISPTLVPEPYSVGVRAVDTSFPETLLSGSSKLASQSEFALAPSPDPKPYADTPPKVSLLNASVPPVDQLGSGSVTGKPTPLIAGEAAETDLPPPIPKANVPQAMNYPEAAPVGEFANPKLAPLASEHAAEPASKQTASFHKDNKLLLAPTERKLSAPLPKKTSSDSEAWAQQLPQTLAERRYGVVTAIRASDPLVVQALPVKAPPLKAPVEMRLVDTARLVASPQTAMAAPVEFAALIIQPDVTETMVPKEPAPLTQTSAWSIGPAPSSSATRSDPVGVISHPLPSLETAVGSAAQTPRNTASAVATGLATLTDSSSVSPEPSSAGTEVPSKGNPQPSSPAVPLDNGYFGLSDGGQPSSGGIGISLLLGVLGLNVVLLRRQEGFLPLVSWKFPKPGSALLVPLERPG